MPACHAAIGAKLRASTAKIHGEGNGWVRPNVGALLFPKKDAWLESLTRETHAAIHLVIHVLLAAICFPQGLLHCRKLAPATTTATQKVPTWADLVSQTHQSRWVEPWKNRSFEPSQQVKEVHRPRMTTNRSAGSPMFTRHPFLFV